MATLNDWVELLQGTAEAVGFPISQTCADMMALDLGGYEFDQVKAACAKCRRELKFRLTLSDIIDRLQAEDGRPGPDEAWLMVMKDDDYSQLTNNEIDEASKGVMEAIRAGNAFGAERSFKELYPKVVKKAREQGRIPVYRVSIGQLGGNEQAISEGLKSGVLAINYLEANFPEDQIRGAARLGNTQLALPPPPSVDKTKAIAAKMLILAMLENKSME